jgi:hypothetical protein
MNVEESLPTLFVGKLTCSECAELMAENGHTTAQFCTDAEMVTETLKELRWGVIGEVYYVGSREALPHSLAHVLDEAEQLGLAVSRYKAPEMAH